MTTENPIKPLLRTLATTLADAAQYADEGYEAMRNGNQNQAIGTIIYLEHLLPTAQALYTSAIALHRLPRKGGAQ
jgi:hypothetical protein